jgi:hypothetical protein
MMPRSAVWLNKKKNGTAVNLSEIIEAIKADLGLISTPITIRRAPPCETRYNDGYCIKERRGYTILINDYVKDGARSLGLVAHELRHVWQYEAGFAMALADNFASKAEYDASAEEIDANAYAAVVSARYAGIDICYWR